MVKTVFVRPPTVVDGAYRATCSDLDIQIGFEAYSRRGSAARWRALVLDYEPSSVKRISEGNAARGVVVRPSTGTLAAGSNATISVSGKYTSTVQPTKFWVVVEAPVDSGNFTATPFHCITT